MNNAVTREGTERANAKCNISYKATTARLMVTLCQQYLHDSRATEIIKMHIEWALESNTNPTTIISL